MCKTFVNSIQLNIWLKKTTEFLGFSFRDLHDFLQEFLTPWTPTQKEFNTARF